VGFFGGGSSKGKLIICDDKGNKKKELSFMFNPSQYVISTAPSYRRNTSLGQGGAPPEFVMGTSRSLSTTLFFDSHFDALPTSMWSLADFTSFLDIGENKLKPVTDQTKVLEEAVQVVGSEHKPPLVKFQWGNLNFMGVVRSLTEEYTMFTASGKPIRARVSINIEEVDTSGNAGKKSPFESPDRTKARTITEGMTLWALAAEEYNDAEKWRVISKANNIMNPLDIRPGQVISVPALDLEER